MPYPTWAAGQKVTAAQLQGMQWQVVTQGSDQTVNNSTTVVSTNLTLNAVSGARYTYQLLVTYTSGATPDIKFRWTFPTSATIDRFILSAGSASTGSSENLTTSVVRRASEFTEVPAAGTGTSPVTLIYTERGEIYGGTGGAVTLQFAQNTTNASDTIVQSLSRLEYLRIA